MFKPNRAQKKAIEFAIDVPLKVIAGAGTGKTELLTRRFVHLVKHYNVQPHRILALTFTKKAAAEMRHRIIHALSLEKIIDDAEAAVMMWIGNFHSIALRLLKQNPVPAGLDPFFEIIDEADQRLVLREVIYDFMDKRLNEDDEFEKLMIIDADGFMEILLSVINRLKSAFVEPLAAKGHLLSSLGEQYRMLVGQLNATVDNREIPAATRKAAKNRRALIDKDRSFEETFIAAASIIYKSYSDRLASRNVLDFNDLVYYAYKLVKAEPEIRKKFDYILVDEFQDTDQGQYKLIEELSRNLRNVTVVGDKKQLIYEWRQAKLENVGKFPGETIALDENYRSFGQILDTANAFVQTAMPEEPALQPARSGGRGWAQESPVRLFCAGNRELEAAFVAKEIRRLLAQKYAPGDIAILVRGINFSKHLEDALEEEKLSYTTIRGCGFYEMKETKDILALLRLVCNPFDDLSMVRVLQSDLIGLNDASLFTLSRRRNDDVTSFYDLLRKGDILHILPAGSAKVRAFVELIEHFARSRWTMSLGELYSEILSRTRYIRYLESEEGPRGPRFANAALLYRIVTLFEERHPGDALEEFLSYIDLTESCSTKSSGNLVSNKIQIMTIHQAKGLEFPVVFVAGVTPGVFPPISRSGNFGYEDEFGIFAKRHPDNEPLVRYEGNYGLIDKVLREKHFLEENRVMYVALTRAKERLYVTSHGSKAQSDRDFFRLIQGTVLEENNASTDAGAGISRSESKEGFPQEGSHLQFQEVLNAASAALTRMAAINEQRETRITRKLDLTYSKLALFRQCPRKYAFHYLYKLPDLPQTESADEDYASGDYGGPVLGNLLHATLMHYHRELKRANKMDAIAVFTHLAKQQNCSRKVLKIGEGMLEKYLTAALSKKQTVFEEKEFCWRIADDELQIRMFGKIDCIIQEGRNYKIVDYKSGSKEPETHKFQLALYKLALESILPQTNILTSNFYFSTGEEVVHSFSELELARVKEQIIQGARGIASGIFLRKYETKERDDCNACEFRQYC